MIRIKALAVLERQIAFGNLNIEKVMGANIGTVDRTVRIVIGLLLIAYAIPVGFPATGWNWVGWIGIVPILTAIAGYCPAYSVFGCSTIPRA